MQSVTDVAILKIKNQPDLFTNESKASFWRDYAIRVLISVQSGIPIKTQEYEEIEEFIKLLPDALYNSAEVNFDFDEDVDLWPRIKEDGNEQGKVAIGIG